MAGDSKPKTDVGAAVAGAGTGTSLLGAINLLPGISEDTRTFLAYVTPTVAIVVGIVWSRVVALAKDRVMRRRLHRLIEYARQEHGRVFADPKSSTKDKGAITEKLKQLESLQYELMTADARQIQLAISELK